MLRFSLFLTIKPFCLGSTANPTISYLLSFHLDSSPYQHTHTEQERDAQSKNPHAHTQTKHRAYFGQTYAYKSLIVWIEIVWEEHLYCPSKNFVHGWNTAITHRWQKNMRRNFSFPSLSRYSMKALTTHICLSGPLCYLDLWRSDNKLEDRKSSTNLPWDRECAFKFNLLGILTYLLT